MPENCFFHSENPATINCFQCTKFICDSCKRFSYGYIYCPSCFESANKCKTQFQPIDEFQYQPVKHKKGKKVFKFLFKLTFRLMLLGSVAYGYQNKSFVMDWVFKKGYGSVLKNISPELTKLIEDAKTTNPMDIVRNPVANIQLKTFAKGLEFYKTVYGNYPNDFESFVRDNFESEAEGKDITKDAWGQSYKYVNKGNTYELSSAGPDGTFGTDDDISFGK